MAASAAAESTRRGSALGLSSCYISPSEPQVHLRKPIIRVALGGNRVRLRGRELSGDTLRAKALQHRPSRGTIKEFSFGSRRRLLEKLGEVDQRQLLYRPLMVTLTYPASWPTDPAVWKKQVQAFVKRLERLTPGAAVFWRLEAQERGAPHFHLLVFNLRYLEHEWVGTVWAEITDGNPKACARVERVRSWRGVMSYASKYLAKVGGDRCFRAGADGDPIEEVGRLWGVMNGKFLPTDVRTWFLDESQFFRIRRYIYGHLGAVARSAGRKRRRRPHDSTSGVSAFLNWTTAVELINLERGDVPLDPLLRETMRMEEANRWKREALAEAARRGLAQREGGREHPQSRRSRSLSRTRPEAS